MFNQIQELDIPAALNTINHYSTEELKQLLNDDEKFKDIVKDVKQFKDLEAEKEMLIAGNQSLAEFNLSKQPQLEEGKKDLQEICEKGSLLGKSVQEKIDLIQDKSGSMSIDTALELLQTAATEIEEESEKLAEKFLAGDYEEVDEFLEQFLIRRKLMHLRKVKVDKMRELKRKSSMRTISPGYPSSSNLFTMGQSTVPYPTGAVGMPMPVQPMYRPY